MLGLRLPRLFKWIEIATACKQGVIARRAGFAMTVGIITLFALISCGSSGFSSTYKPIMPKTPPTADYSEISFSTTAGFINIKIQAVNAPNPYTFFPLQSGSRSIKVPNGDYDLTIVSENKVYTSTSAVNPECSIKGLPLHDNKVAFMVYFDSSVPVGKPLSMQLEDYSNLKTGEPEYSEIVVKNENAIKYSNSLQDLMKIPQYRCHLLKGRLKGLYALDILHPDRIVIEPLNDPLPQTGNNEIDISKVTKVKIVYIGDYHGKVIHL
jgi:proteic killer suppression protein